MWLFTETGFISAVKYGTDLIVRSRDKESLEALAFVANTEIIHTPLSDYPYRITTNQDIFTKWVSHVVNAIDYSNFKSQVAVTRGTNFADTLTEVWSVMHKVEDEEARNEDKFLPERGIN